MRYDVVRPSPASGLGNESRSVSRPTVERSQAPSALPPPWVARSDGEKTATGTDQFIFHKKFYAADQHSSISVSAMDGTERAPLTSTDTRTWPMLSTLLFGDASSSEPSTEPTSESDRSKSKTSSDSPARQPKADRRGSRRAPSRCLARVWWEDREDPIFGRLKDLSESGCRLLTERTFEPGQAVTLELTVLGRTPRITIEAKGVIRHIDSSAQRRAYGIEFTDLDPSTERAMHWLYDREKTLHPLNARPTDS